MKRDDVLFDDKNIMAMKLLHYFITEKNYNPIILQGVEDEIWLENLQEDYQVVRIVSGYIHNNEQFDFDIYCTGSDQVWNCGWNEQFDYPYYLFPFLLFNLIILHKDIIKDTNPNINNTHANTLGEISLPSFTVSLPAKINTASKHATTDKINRIISSSRTYCNYLEKGKNNI